MTKTYDVDGYLYTPESFFLAVITAVGPKQGTPENYPCSWKQYPFAPSGSGLDLNNNQSIMFGDYTQNKNTAYPINNAVEPVVDSVVLMRFRLLSDTGVNIYEFVSAGGGGGSQPSTSCFGIKSLQCSAGTLMAVFADSGGCYNTCTAGLAFYQLITEVNIPYATNTPIPMAWTLLSGDLEGTGLVIDGQTFKNTFGADIHLKITAQVYWSPSDLNYDVHPRRIWISKNGNEDDRPIANYSSQAYGTTAQTATNYITLANGDYFQLYAYNGTNVTQNVGGIQPVPTTLLIERYCT